MKEFEISQQNVNADGNNNCELPDYDNIKDLTWINHLQISYEPYLRIKSKVKQSTKKVSKKTSGENSNQHFKGRNEIFTTKDDYKTNKNLKPNYSYSQMIKMAMESNGFKLITLSKIYEWIRTNFAYYRKIDEKAWQNSIRHNLSMCPCFQKVPRNSDDPGKGGYWTYISPESGKVNKNYLNGNKISIKPFIPSSNDCGLNYLKNMNDQMVLPQLRNPILPNYNNGLYEQLSKTIERNSSSISDGMKKMFNNYNSNNGDFFNQSLYNENPGDFISSLFDDKNENLLSNLSLDQEVKIPNPFSYNLSDDITQKFQNMFNTPKNPMDNNEMSMFQDIFYNNINTNSNSNAFF